MVKIRTKVMNRTERWRKSEPRDSEPNLKIVKSEPKDGEPNLKIVKSKPKRW